MSGHEALAVDVLVNNHNYARYLGEAVESALAQDHPRVRVIVVDDGSTDDSLERLGPLGDRVELIAKRAGGQASALNAAFVRSRGDVVIFLDADDVLTPAAAARAAAAFAADPDAMRLQFRTQLIDAAGRPLPDPPASPPRSGDLRHAELAFPFDLPTVPTSANAFRRAALQLIMPIPEWRYGRWGADYYLVHLTTLLGPVIAVDEVGARYRVHGANAFQPSRPLLDLDRIRLEIDYQQATAGELASLADRLGLARPQRILSLSNLSLRIISRKLAPERHPLAGDRLPGLLADSVRAARRRFDTPAPRLVLLLGVLCAIAAAPRPLARRLAALLVFPQLRPSASWWRRGGA